LTLGKRKCGAGSCLGNRRRYIFQLGHNGCFRNFSGGARRRKPSKCRLAHAKDMSLRHVISKKITWQTSEPWAS